MSIKTTYQKIMDWNYRLGERMKQPVEVHEVVHDHHICKHCGYGYDGSYCPQCGMPATHVRFTFKRLVQNFLDIWGLGNRPMFRSMRDLLWRPGYMICDYLNGHHLSYFPPFKMLAVLTLFIVFIAWCFDFKDPLVAEQMVKNLQHSDEVSETASKIYGYIASALIYLDKNDLYRILAQNVLVVIAAWVVFHNRGFNLVETFFSQIYINCQFHIITLVWMLIAHNLPPVVLLPYYVPFPIAVIVLIFDFKQLYGLTFKQSIWRTILFLLLLFTIYSSIFTIAIVDYVL